VTSSTYLRGGLSIIIIPFPVNMEAGGRRAQRWRTNCCSVAEEICISVLALMAVVAGVSGRTISRQVSSPDEIVGSRAMSSKSREITLPDEIRRRCEPVPHDVLWLRLNIAPRLPSSTDTVLANGPQVDRHSETVPPLYNVDQQPDVDTDFRSQDGGSRRRYRRNTKENRSRRQRRRKQQQQQQLRHSHKRSRRRRLLAKLSDGGAWHCHMTSHWLRMPDDVFPPYVETGSCSQSRCMMGLYECRARKYATRILRRLPGRCNPVPVSGDVTEGAGFEEAWSVEEYQVVVGCECSKRRTSGWYDE